MYTQVETQVAPKAVPYIPPEVATYVKHVFNERLVRDVKTQEQLWELHGMLKVVDWLTATSESQLKDQLQSSKG